ncbi:MAG TPA: serine protease [Edaphobacter sp.]|nr:serine protease [Edaphobacter sp.]
MIHRRPVGIVLSAALIFLVKTIPCFGILPDDAIVRILAYTNDGKVSVGTGSLISSDGRILTCYHVIRDSKAIEIYYKSKKIPLNVRVFSISADYDLAILKMDSFPAGQQFLQLSEVAPSDLSPNSKAVGFPAVTTFNLQDLNIHSTSRSYVSSTGLRTNDGRALFRGDIDLITFEMVIYGGVSGAPIISNGRIVGIISGSWLEGGSLGWAIPEKYVNLGETKVVDQLPREVRSWPALSLTSDALPLKRSGASLTVPLVYALVEYAAALRDMKQTCARELENASQLKVILESELEQANAAETARGATFVVSTDPSLIASLNDVRIPGMLISHSRCTNAFNIIHEDGDQLTRELSIYVDTILPNPKTKKVLEITLTRESKVTGLLRELDTADEGATFAASSSATIGDYQNALTTDLRILVEKDPGAIYQALVDSLDGYYQTIDDLLAAQPNQKL